VWHEGLDQWTTAGKVEELKDLFTVTPPALVPETKTEEKPPMVVGETTNTVTASEAPKPVTVAATSAPVAAATVATPISKAKQPQKGNAWVSWVLALLIIGGAGYYIYQDMEKNKTASVNAVNTDTTKNMTKGTNTDTNGDNIIVTSPDTTLTVVKTDTMGTATVPPVTVTTVTTTDPNDPAAVKKAADDKKKLLAIQAKKKADEDKKKQLALDAKRKDDENKN
jgi:hypothetical protein